MLQICLRILTKSNHFPALRRLQTRRYHPHIASTMVQQNGITPSRTVDLRSDTVTRPSAEMKEAMVKATLGDDVLCDDPTVTELEVKAAKLMGFEKALYVPSGTMANLIAVMVHCNGRDSEILLGNKCHISLYEQGGVSTIAGVHPRQLPNNPDGTIDIAELRAGVRSKDVHFPVTRLICLENTHNYCGGKVLPLEYLDKVVALSKELGIPLHMDGARLPNAAVYCGVPMDRLLRGFASSTLCLSKSLGAPIGSLLAGSADFIASARRMRKVLGGGMRQAGIIAAAGIVALNTMGKLAVDFEHARMIGEAVNSVGHPGVHVDLANLHTNILLVQLSPDVIAPADFCSRMATSTAEEVDHLKEAVAVRMFPMSATNVRMVLHCDISREDVHKVVNKIKFVIAELQKQNGGVKKPKLEVEG